MPALRVLIVAGSAKRSDNYRSLFASDGTVLIVGPGEGADVTLIDLTDLGSTWPDAVMRSGPTLFLLPEEASPALVAQATAHGGSVVSDRVSRERLLLALKAVAAGFEVREPEMSPVRLRGESPPVAEQGVLTEREQQILQLLGEGLGNRDIAHALTLSDHTVKFHLRSIFQKLGVRSRTEAVSTAVRRGLIML
jgi:DNA-binding NarL/FixJ family response regulator